MDLHKYSQLTFEKGAKAIQRTKESVFKKMLLLRHWTSDYFPRAAITYYHKLGDLNSRILFPHILTDLEVRSPKSRYRQCWFFLEALNSMLLSKLLVIANNPWQFLVCRYTISISVSIFPGCSTLCLCVFPSFLIMVPVTGFRAHPNPG